MEWFQSVREEYAKQLALKPLPEGVSEVVEVPYQPLSEALENRDPEPFIDLVGPLVSGAFLLLKKAFSENDVSRMKQISLDMRRSQPPSFHKLLEGVPNFWRDIGEKEMGSYALAHIKKSTYFFPWNTDSAEAFEIAYPKWRVAKTLGGLSPNQYENFTPKDGTVDRLQVVEYPAGTGFVAPHQDPDHNQRVIISGYLSKRGLDYVGGGFWAQSQSGDKIEIEDVIDVGDIGVCAASIVHGVDATQGPLVHDSIVSAPDYGEAEAGSRWFVGFAAADSDEVSERKTVRQVNLQ